MIRYFLFIMLMPLLFLSACASHQHGITGEDIPEPVTPVEEALPVKPPPPPRPVLGWVENVRVGDINTTLKAKLDPGARTSSIDADVIRTFERDGQEYVLFRVDFNGEEETFEAPVIRWANIRSRQEGETFRRPVIEMTLCIGDQNITGEINLAERGHFNYPVLIGRNALQKGNILVDSSATFQHSPSCT